MPPLMEYLVSMLSVLRCGEAFLPLDPSWPKQRLFSIIVLANVDLIITCRTPFGYKLDSNWLEQSCNRNSLWFSIGGEFVTVSDGGECRRESEKEDERLFCYVMYSSGSTGKPKGVCGTEQGLWNRFLWMQELYPLNGEEVLLFKTAISFVDHFQAFLNAILTGFALVIPPFNQLKQNVFSIVDFLQFWRCSLGFSRWEDCA
ncbi:putative AMP-dependent synthetase/ligase [Rosa chinensis]|uniref:Putative AMP-dependent synthetase/ligase n=1 Tax=Rosa chinensis TaxID=74649 RepID=A0A2P6RMR3_ROSCH|nr:putative acyl-activating enzyme 19 [Rosa chinensis]PRQ47729.1 putative AMP-dependent synthetase/ligase [Rosa chinensis]